MSPWQHTMEALSTWEGDSPSLGSLPLGGQGEPPCRKESVQKQDLHVPTEHTEISLKPVRVYIPVTERTCFILGVCVCVCELALFLVSVTPKSKDPTCPACWHLLQVILPSTPSASLCQRPRHLPCVAGSASARLNSPLFRLLWVQ